MEIRKIEPITVRRKKAVMNEVVSIFIVMLIVSVLSALSFLFVASLKTQVQTTAEGGVNSTAYKAVNTTETAGYTTVNYLGLLFLAMIFGAILTVVLRLILPYVNLGQNLGGF